MIRPIVFSITYIVCSPVFSLLYGRIITKEIQRTFFKIVISLLIFFLLIKFNLYWSDILFPLGWGILLGALFNLDLWKIINELFNRFKRK